MNNKNNYESKPRIYDEGDGDGVERPWPSLISPSASGGVLLTMKLSWLRFTLAAGNNLELLCASPTRMKHFRLSWTLNKGNLAPLSANFDKFKTGIWPTSLGRRNCDFPGLDTVEEPQVCV